MNDDYEWFRIATKNDPDSYTTAAMLVPGGMLIRAGERAGSGLALVFVPETRGESEVSRLETALERCPECWNRRADLEAKTDAEKPLPPLLHPHKILSPE